MVAWVLVILQAIVLSYVILSSSACSEEKLASIINQMNEKTLFEGYGQEIKVSVKNKAANNENNNANVRLKSTIKMNDHDQSYYDTRRTIGQPNSSSYYENPVIHPKDAGLVSRVWRSNGSPSINSGLHQGSCWCSFDEWCVCTPALAIDLIMTSGPDHLWVVQRADTGLLALMGGFTEVGELSLDTVSRELMEEMNIALEPTNHPKLFGVYNDP